MTSKNSFYNMLFLALKNRIWGIALSCICLFFSLPIYGAIYASMLSERIYTSATQSMLNRLFRSYVLGERNAFTSFVVFMLAVFFALNGFMYLFSRQKTDLYHALPIKRSLLFTTNYLAGIIAFIIPYIAFTILAICVGSMYGYINADSIKVAVCMAFINVLAFILEYSVSITMIMLTGNLPVSLLAIGTINLYGPSLSLINNMYQADFFCTYSALSEEGSFTYTSPITILSALGDSLNSISNDFGLNLVLAAQIIIAIILITIIAYYLYKIKPTESAGKAIAHRKMIPFLSVLIITPFALTGAIAFGEITDSISKDVYGWFIFGMIATTIIIHFILQTIYYLDYKSLFKNLQLPAISLAIAAIIAMIYIFDLTGYDNYIPGEKTDYIALSSYAFQGSQEYLDFTAEPDEWGYNNYEIDMNTYRFNNMKLTDSALYIPFIKAAIEDSEANHALFKNDDIEISTIPIAYIDACFVDNKGHKTYRNYTVDINKIVDLYNAIYCTKEYKEGVFPILTASDEELIEDLTFMDGINTVNLDALSAAEKKELLDTYKKELMSQDIYDAKNNIPIGYICNLKSAMNSDYMSTYRNNKGYIYPSFTNTIALLEKYNLPIESYKDPSTVEMIKISNYNLPDGESENIDISFTDDKSIKEILDAVYPYDLICADEIFHPSANLDCELHYKNATFNNVTFANVSMVEDKVPDFVKDAVKYNAE